MLMARKFDSLVNIDEIKRCDYFLRMFDDRGEMIHASRISATEDQINIFLDKSLSYHVAQSHNPARLHRALRMALIDKMTHADAGEALGVTGGRFGCLLKDALCVMRQLLIIKRASSIDGGYLGLNVDDAFVSKPVRNSLENINARTVSDVVSHSVEDFMKLKNFGRDRLRILADTLSHFGLRLRGDNFQIRSTSSDLRLDNARLRIECEILRGHIDCLNNIMGLYCSADVNR